MVEKRPIDKLTIKGFKTLQDVELELGQLNVLIGPNGAGKSNLVSYFRMLIEMLGGRLQVWVAKRGGASRLLTFGAGHTTCLSSDIHFDDMSFQLYLEPTDTDRFTISVTNFGYQATPTKGYTYGLVSGTAESQMHRNMEGNGPIPYPNIIYNSMANWRAYHIQDTSSSAPVKLTSQLHDNRYLRQDAGNLAAYLYMLKHVYKDIYGEIVETARLAIPFLDNFVLEPEALNANSIMLKWRHKDFDYEFIPSQLSDGSLRFICLVTALMQPDPPSTIIIDEPELGLHPYAITLLGSLLESASERMQVIVATQSPQLLDEFSVDDLIVVELLDGVSIFKRLKECDFDVWLKDFSVGELWDKNVLGGGLP
ncbi:MAG: AAA family ATPase [Chloroflexi bacterium]|nr:AAA family ATPase [Chloroflexota bacterium]